MQSLVRGWTKHLTPPVPGWQRTGPLDPGLIGEWRFGRNTGLLLPDYAGRGYHGDVVGADWTVTRHGPALLFGANDTVSLPSTLVVDNTVAFTLEAFVHLDAFTVSHPAICCLDVSDGTFNLVWVLSNAGGSGYEPMWWGNGGGECYMGRIPDDEFDFNDFPGTWRHLMLVCDGVDASAAGSWTPYIDGIAYGVGANPGVPNKGVHQIAGYGDANMWWHGKIALFRIYQRELSAAEVRARRQICLKRAQPLTHAWMMPWGMAPPAPPVGGHMTLWGRYWGP